MPTANRFQLGGPLGGMVAGLQDAAELSLLRTRATTESYRAAILAEEREAVRGKRREWEKYEGFRLAERQVGLQHAIAQARGAEVATATGAYNLAEAMRTQDLRDRAQIAGIESTEVQTEAARYGLMESIETRDLRDAQRQANLAQTISSTDANQLAIIQGTAEFQEYLRDRDLRSAQRRANIRRAEFEEENVARGMESELYSKELTNRVNEIKLDLIQNDAKLEKEAQWLAELKAVDTQSAFDAYKIKSDDPNLDRYDLYEEAKPYLGRKAQATLMNTATKRQLLLKAAQRVAGTTNVELAYNQIMGEIFNDGIDVLLKDPNKRWFMTIYKAGGGTLGDPMGIMLHRMFQELGADGTANSMEELGKGTPDPGPPIAPPPNLITEQEVELIDQVPAAKAQYDRTYGPGAFSRAKAKFEYNPTQDEPLGLKQ